MSDCLSTLSLPRSVTAAVRRQSRREPRVRFWNLAALVFVIATLVLGYSQWRDWSYDSWLIHHGALTEAVILSVGGVERAGFEVPTPADVVVQFDLNGRTIEAPGRIEPADGFKFVSPHLPLKIRIDPAAAQKWTARIEADPLIRQFVGPAILLLFAIACFAVACWRQRGILGTWRQGIAVEGIVQSIGRSALAPRSWCVRYSRRDGKDNRLLTLYMPQRLGAVHKGDALQILSDPRRPTQAILSRLYQ